MPSTQVNLTGGTLLLNGNTDTVGALQLTSSSVLNLSGTGSGITFAASNSQSWTGAAVLSVWNWSNATPVNFTSATGLTGGQLAQISVFSDGGTTPAAGGVAFTLDGGGNLVPVPEPGALLGVLALLAPLAWRERRHWARCREARVG